MRPSHPVAGPSGAAGSPISPRRDFLRGAAATLASAGLLGVAPSSSFGQGRAVAADAVPPSAEYVVRSATILTMDPALGDLMFGDIHVRNGAIAAVGANQALPSGIDVVDGAGMIVMPGLCDSHWHMWNTLFKNMVTPKASYADLTTVLNYAHHTQSPAHVDGEIRAPVPADGNDQRCAGPGLR